MTTAYDLIKEKRLEIKTVAFELEDLAGAFYKTGNDW